MKAHMAKRGQHVPPSLASLEDLQQRLDTAEESISGLKKTRSMALWLAAALGLSGGWFYHSFRAANDELARLRGDVASVRADFDKEKQQAVNAAVQFIQNAAREENIKLTAAATPHPVEIPTSWGKDVQVLGDYSFVGNSLEMNLLFQLKNGTPDVIKHFQGVPLTMTLPVSVTPRLWNVQLQWADHDLGVPVGDAYLSCAAGCWKARVFLRPVVRGTDRSWELVLCREVVRPGDMNAKKAFSIGCELVTPESFGDSAWPLMWVGDHGRMAMFVKINLSPEHRESLAAARANAPTR